MLYANPLFFNLKMGEKHACSTHTTCSREFNQDTGKQYADVVKETMRKYGVVNDDLAEEIIMDLDEEGMLGDPVVGNEDQSD